ncbi:BA14K family protein [Bradyrhizobium sp. 2]|uniref:BA14K family protein n=1 Tax=Bradyrhizobium sp. 2 TaxID=190045 RepID=UPI001FF9B9C6|nr:BA14K family protein [Bradyrhizobium sp. 2]MCK1462982.1 BA14K family protein [Bradyrhizobium sp. 2]
MRQSTNFLAAILLATSPLVAIRSASAAPLSTGRTLSEMVETIQYRHQGRHHGAVSRHGGYGYHRGQGRYSGGYQRNGAAVLGGIAAGAIIGGAIANSQARGESDGYCAQRFRSYDPASGTYLGNDGQRHSCP